jgi:hypothetical protein
LGVLNKAWDLQYRIEARLKKIKPLSFKEFCFLTVFINYMLGFVLLVYVFMTGTSLMNLQPLSSPLHYLVLGTIFLFVYMKQIAVSKAGKMKRCYKKKP